MLAVLSVPYKGVIDRWNEGAFNRSLYYLVLLLCSKIDFFPFLSPMNKRLAVPKPLHAGHWQTPGHEDFMDEGVLGTDLLPPIFTGFYPPCVSKHHCEFALGTCPAVTPAIPPTPHGSKCSLLTFITWKKRVPVSLLWLLLCHVVQGCRVR